MLLFLSAIIAFFPDPCEELTESKVFCDHMNQGWTIKKVLKYNLIM